MNYKIIPNFLSEEEHKEIFDRIQRLDFYYQKTIAERTDNSGFFFCNKLYDAVIKRDLDPTYLPIITPLLYKGLLREIYRVQVNCFIKQSKPIFTGIHTDDPRSHNVLLYFVNTNNGYTILDPNGKNIKVPSVANQALFFDGKIEHQAVTQTDENVRFNININFPT